MVAGYRWMAKRVERWSTAFRDAGTRRWQPQGMDTTLVTALRKVLSQESGQSVELIETHLSWVLLAPVYAYNPILFG